MIKRFQKYYEDESLFNSTDKVLLTVSGGKDSMSMVHLFMKAELSFGIAHCNFNLRGEDADKDEDFVKQFCLENEIEFYSISFKTSSYAKEKGISIQMAARDLRYNWFEKIREENGFQFIATAHHKNDVAETMLINLTKGTGLAGLHGISNKRGNIIRPLLCFDAKEIELFVLKNKIEFRQDLSNSDTKYTRNAIRHKVIPELEKINSAFVDSVVKSSNQFAELEEILEQKIEDEKRKLFIKDGLGFKIEIQLLKELNPIKTYLYYLLKPFNFNAADVLDIINGLNGQSGQVFYSSTHQIVKDREYLFLNEKSTASSSDVKNILNWSDFPFRYKELDINSNYTIKKEQTYAYLDADKIDFPMIIRPWEEGDVFQPLGMKGKKKVSDFLIDNKISILHKKDVKLLVCHDEIVWVIGYRISDKFKITNSTQKGIILSL